MKASSSAIVVMLLALCGCSSPAPAPSAGTSPAPASAPSEAVAISGEWTSYGEFMFGDDASVVAPADRAKVAAIAEQMRKHPKFVVGLDGALAPTGTDPADQPLANRRVAAVRSALIGAGVPAARIQVGSFGNLMRRRDRRVEVLFTRADT